MGKFDHLVKHGVADGFATWSGSDAVRFAKRDRVTRLGCAIDLFKTHLGYRDQNIPPKFTLGIEIGVSGRRVATIDTSDENAAVDQYLAVVWALGAPIRRPRTGFDTVDDLVVALPLQPASALDYLSHHSRRVRALEMFNVARRFMLVSFFDTDPAALEGVPFITSRYENVTVLEIEIDF